MGITEHSQRYNNLICKTLDSSFVDLYICTPVEIMYSLTVSCLSCSLSRRCIQPVNRLITVLIVLWLGADVRLDYLVMRCSTGLGAIFPAM